MVDTLISIGVLVGLLIAFFGYIRIKHPQPWKQKDEDRLWPF